MWHVTSGPRRTADLEETFGDDDDALDIVVCEETDEVEDTTSLGARVAELDALFPIVLSSAGHFFWRDQ